MTYLFDTLNSRNSSAPSAPSGLKRFAREVGLIIGLVALVFWLAALLSYSPQDAAWSTSGNPDALPGQSIALNWGGQLGARVADASYFLLGFSAWWALGCRLQSLAAVAVARLQARAAGLVQKRNLRPPSPILDWVAAVAGC